MKTDSEADSKEKTIKSSSIAREPAYGSHGEMAAYRDETNADAVSVLGQRA